MPAILWARQASGGNVTASTGPEDGPRPSHVSAGEMVGAIVVPIVLVVSLMTIFVICRRRRRTEDRGRGEGAARVTTGEEREPLHGLLRFLQESFTNPPRTPNTATNRSTGSERTNTPVDGTANTRRSRRGRRERLRRTDSGLTVKTLPEYNELGEDEILLYKATAGPDLELAVLQQPPPLEERESQRGSRRSGRSSVREVAVQTRSASRSASPSNDVSAGVQAVSRQSSLAGLAADGLSALRRLSVRRRESSSNEASEMGNMMEGQESSSAPEVIAEESTPQYDNLYPALPPQVQVYGVEGAVGEEDNGQRRGALRSFFRRGGTNDEAVGHRRVLSTNALSASADLSLTPTRSIEASLYRPSTSSSSHRMMFGSLLSNGSSASLLSQFGGNGGSALEGEAASQSRSSVNLTRHTRNISAPISTRRLQFAPPVAGFSDKQMQFLTSVESLDKYGIPVRDGEGHETGQRQPPSFEELARVEGDGVEAQSAPATRLAPLLTSAETHSRQERSPISPLPLPTSSVEAEASGSTGDDGLLGQA